MKCKIHPKYKGVRPPTSKKKNCTCMNVFAQVIVLQQREVLESLKRLEILINSGVAE